MIANAIRWKQFLFAFPFAGVFAATLEVGPGLAFERVEDALAAAGAGDTLLVRPRPGGAAYERPALLVNKPVIIRAAGPVVFDGAGFDYSGNGRVPRAIVQFDPGASGSTLEGFTLVNARNGWRNAAGVRVNQANNITVTNCVIRACEMGIMSNGSVAGNTATNQLFTHCLVTLNGSPGDGGQSHNLYLGGTDATLRHCEVSHSTSGNNVKSRAHVTRVEDCLVHHSANREFDLVDAAGNTDIPGSDAFLIRNTVVKHPGNEGNHNLLHFGRDGAAERTGTLHAVSNVFVSPYQTPLVTLSSRVDARLHFNIVSNSPHNARLLLLRHPDARAFGKGNVFPKALLTEGLAECEDEQNNRAF